MPVGKVSTPHCHIWSKPSRESYLMHKNILMFPFFYVTRKLLPLQEFSPFTDFFSVVMKPSGTHPVCFGNSSTSLKYTPTCVFMFLVWCAVFGSGKAITYEEFIGYPFEASNGYQLFPRGDDLAQGVNIPFPFPYFNESFTFADVSDSLIYSSAMLTECFPAFQLINISFNMLIGTLKMQVSAHQAYIISLHNLPNYLYHKASRSI